MATNPMQNAVQVGAYDNARSSVTLFPAADEVGLLSQQAFSRRLQQEQRRTERSRRPFLLLLMEAGSTDPGIWQRLQTVVAGTVRETDICGWYQQDAVLGVIFTETGTASGQIPKLLQAKLTAAFSNRLSSEQVGQVTFSFCVYPDDWDKRGPDGGEPSVLYPEASLPSNRAAMFAKRALDIAGSLGALIVAAPIFGAIALAVKLSSAGPVLFRQRRVGQYGAGFTFLKFRSMYADNDPRVHEEYVKSLIAGKVTDAAKGTGKAVYKLANDPRITPIGAWLRKTSLDELPQFLNVLLGEMSLVGPRPPIPYEVAAYDIWHRRRLLAVKPGITGLWQVTGRSRTTFDEMVRLDLQYAKSWSFWLDIKLLIMTPWAVIVGDGAR
jgi:lipopolysaccharide/colanic/teichoic acid biosynthesis glycosyltransferase